MEKNKKQFSSFFNNNLGKDNKDITGLKKEFDLLRNGLKKELDLLKNRVKLLEDQLKRLGK